jgi:hypothetical protein
VSRPKKATESSGNATPEEKDYVKKLIDLVLDSQIIMIGTDMSDTEATEHHYGLLMAFREVFHLALDIDGHVKQQYEDKMSEVSPGRIWIRALLGSGRVVFRNLPTLHKRVRVALDDAHFHTGDRHFVRLATATNTKCLVAQESDYSAKVRKVLWKLAEVRVCTAEHACQLIPANLPDEPAV